MSKGMSVYLAGPIDYVGDLEEGMGGWRRGARDYLSGVCIYDPEYAFANPLVDPEALKTINLAAVRVCAGMLAAVWPRVPSWGTPQEISLAERLGKPIVLWCQEDPPPYLAHLPRYHSLREACERLRAMLEEVPEEDSTMIRNSSVAAPHATPYGRPMEVGPILLSGPARGAIHVALHDRSTEARLLATTSAIAAPKMDGDVGYDLRLLESVRIEPGAFVRLSLGIWSEETGPTALQIAIPKGMWGSILSRSSAACRGLLVFPTVIDSGYRGPLYAFVYHAGTVAIELSRGQRVCQLVLYGSVTPELALVGELPDSERGANGFGSTDERP